MTRSPPEIQTAPVSAALPPADPPTRLAGQVRVSQKNGGAPRTSTVTKVENGVAFVEVSDGCSYSYDVGSFGPSLTYTNCDGNTGSQTGTREGNIFPLQVGSSETWQVSGRNSKGDSWDTTRTCVVTEQARVTAPIGSYDTFHVVCDDEWWKREWYYSPELEDTVIFRRSHKRRAEVDQYDLVSTSSGS